MKIEEIKAQLKPAVIIGFSLLLTTIVVSMIAYANCEEARIFIDNLMNKEVIEATLLQA